MDLAIERVRMRVSEGGHNIPTDTITRRYFAGLKNFLTLYEPIVDYWMLLDNSGTEPNLIAENSGKGSNIVNEEKWQIILKQIHHDTRRN